jgi:UDP-N-acetylmuramate dehydrogenase
MEELIAYLEEIVGKEWVFQNESMSLHTTFRAGGVADCFIEPGSVEEIQKIVTACKQADIPWYVVGNGSNLLVSDKGYHGVILHLGNHFSDIAIKGTDISVLAGTALTLTARKAASEGLGGMAFAGGIPGSFGGAVVMNAGAYGGEMSQVLQKVTLLDEDGQVKTLPLEELGLGYRQSIFKGRKRIVLEGFLSLSESSKEEELAQIRELNQKRKEKQPLEYPSAGSTFKRPEGYFAGKLIEDCGLKGFSIGDAQVSEKHCGFVINRGHASASQLFSLFEEVKNRVYQQFGVEMELEVQLLGEF